MIWAVPVLFSIVVHEVAHGWMALRLGDDTAKKLGRLTLNPVNHIDPVGTIILPFSMMLLGGPVFGWAKPVPINPYNFLSRIGPRKGTMRVALAGPGSNFLLALLASFIFVGTQRFLSGGPGLIYFSLLKLSHALIYINLVLASLNLIPVPPLDGSKILMGILPETYDRYFLMIERYGFIIIVVLLASGAFSGFILGAVDFLYKVVLWLPQLML
jgi:Zn-dependent protease